VSAITGELPRLIFDGDCGFCTTTARWVERHWTVPAEAVAWQSLGENGLASLGLTERDVRTAAYWVDRNRRTSRGHAAVAKALLAGDAWMRLVGALLLVPPISWLARPGYWLVAKFRHRLPGATEACRL
jgi:predicted DCC family thiol-disulfide oxidoreductase YuxK